VARQIIAALEQKGVLVFPNLGSCWHYDDKVGQKYLLEAIGAPVIPSWVFTNSAEAEEWIAQATWPKVFKLRSGSASENVRLVETRRQAERICRRAFTRGFPAKPGYLSDVRVRLCGTGSWRQAWEKLGRVPASVLEVANFRHHSPRQQGYVYFQEFLPGNSFDTRVFVIGQRAFGLTRQNRPNDFRASGGGRMVYDAARIDRRSVDIAFQVAGRLGSQSLAFDFLFDLGQQPRISEISYAYPAARVRECPGYWDRELGWHAGHFWAEDMILEDVLAVLGVAKEECLAAPTR
jgi:glutathione synthase/RimK-type ligase-like ATP-grasp enzyme